MEGDKPNANASAPNTGEPHSAIEPNPLATYLDRKRRLVDWLRFWLWVWVGTVAAAASLFALVFLLLDPRGAVIWVIVGALYVGTFGCGTIASVALIAWASMANRTPFWSAAAAGGMTGVVCAVNGAPPGWMMLLMTAVAAGIGATGAVLAAWRFWNSPGAVQLRTDHAQEVALQRWRRFTIANLFLRMTVVAVVVAFWTQLYRCIVEFE